MTHESKGVNTVNFNNGPISNSSFIQGNGNTNNKITQTIGNNQPENTLTPRDVLNILAEMNTLVNATQLPGPSKNKCLRHLRSVEEEVQEDEPDKDYAAKGMKKVVHILKETGMITSAATDMSDQIESLLARMLPWLGVEKNFFVL